MLLCNCAWTTQHLTTFGDDHRAVGRKADNEIMKAGAAGTLAMRGVGRVEIVDGLHAAGGNAWLACHGHCLRAVLIASLRPALHEAPFLAQETLQAHRPPVKDDGRTVEGGCCLKGLLING